MARDGARLVTPVRRRAPGAPLPGERLLSADAQPARGRADEEPLRDGGLAMAAEAPREWWAPPLAGGRHRPVTSAT